MPPGQTPVWVPGAAPVVETNCWLLNSVVETFSVWAGSESGELQVNNFPFPPAGLLLSGRGGLRSYGRRGGPGGARHLLPVLLLRDHRPETPGDHRQVEGLMGKSLAGLQVIRRRLWCDSFLLQGLPGFSAASPARTLVFIKHFEQEV